MKTDMKTGNWIELILIINIQLTLGYSQIKCSSQTSPNTKTIHKKIKHKTSLKGLFFYIINLKKNEKKNKKYIV